MSAGVPSKPHLVRQWVPRQGRFVWYALPCIPAPWQGRLTTKQLMLNDHARAFATRMNRRSK